MSRPVYPVITGTLVTLAFWYALADLLYGVGIGVFAALAVAFIGLLFGDPE